MAAGTSGRSGVIATVALGVCALGACVATFALAGKWAEVFATGILICAAFTTASSLGLPLQNVGFITSILVLFTAAFSWINPVSGTLPLLLGLPAGRRSVFGVVLSGAAWFIAIGKGRLLGRTVAPDSEYRGYYTLGIAVVSASVLVSLLEPILQLATGSARTHDLSTVGVQTIGRTVPMALLLLCLAPWFLQKRPVGTKPETRLLAVQLAALSLAGATLMFKGWFPSR